VRNTLKIILSMAACSVMAMAASPVGKLSASNGVKISGSDVSFRGIPSWPIMAGDRIQTTSMMAVLVLNDGSQFRIAPNSSVQIEATAGKQTVRVVEGQVNGPATVESSLVRLELPAPSRRR
jgi:hypothetical protein